MQIRRVDLPKEKSSDGDLEEAMATTVDAKWGSDGVSDDAKAEKPPTKVEERLIAVEKQDQAFVASSLPRAIELLLHSRSSSRYYKRASLLEKKPWPL